MSITIIQIFRISLLVSVVLAEVHEGMKQKTPLNALLNKALGV